MRIFFSLGTCNRGCAVESSEGTGHANQSRSAQDITVEMPAMFFGSGLWPRDSQDFSQSQSGVRGFKASGPHPQLYSTLYQPKLFILENLVVLPQQAIDTVVPC